VAFFRLLEDMSIDERMHIGLIQDEAGEWLHFMTAKPLPTHATADVHVIGPPLEFFYSSFNAPIACRQLATAMQRLVPGDLELVDLSLSHPVQKDLVAINVLRVQRCVDETQSEFSRFDETDTHRPDLLGKFRGFTKLVVNEGEVEPGAHIFRLADWEVGLIVSGAMRQCMLDAGCVGAEFQLVSPAP
jgi:hypothetical protein